MNNTTEVTEVKNDIGKLIKSVRKSRNISQTKLANRLDVSRNTIQNLESGKNFTIDTLLKALKEFDLLDDIHRELEKYSKDISETKSLY